MYKEMTQGERALYVCMANCVFYVVLWTVAILPNVEFSTHCSTPKRGRKRKNFDEMPAQLTAELAKRRSTRVS